MANTMKFYLSKDGKKFATKKDAYEYEKIKELVEREVPYHDNKALVLEFILTNREEIRKVLKKS